MGANNEEYTKNSASRIEEEHNKSKLGNFYEQKLGKLRIPGLLGPMLGASVGSSLQRGGQDSLGEYITMGGSALGALAAPLMYRTMQKQSIADIKDINIRNSNLYKGSKLSGVQALDSALVAGKSFRNTVMGGLATGYGVSALTGNLMDPSSMALFTKGSSAFSNPGSMAYMAANQLAGANYFGGVGNTHMAALPGKAISGMGSLLKPEPTNLVSPASTALTGSTGLNAPTGPTASTGLEGIGNTLENFGQGVTNMGGMTGTLVGMIPYIMASFAGNKLSKYIKGKAQEKDGSKYKYRVSDIGRPASTYRDVTKYDTMQTVAGQVNLLSITGQLSPFETLALGYYQSIDKHLLFLNAIYDVLEKDENKKYSQNDKNNLLHNELGDLIGNDGDFSTLDSYKKFQEYNYTERTGNRASELYDSFNKKIHNFSTDATAFMDMINPIKILTGGLLGNSSTRDIKALYGLDEDAKKENAIAETASQINVPSSLIQLAEMDISQVMKLSDTIDGKQLAVQSFSASILQNMLKLQLDDRSTRYGDEGFFNATQRNLDKFDDETWLTKFEDKLIDVVGLLPGMNIISSGINIHKGLQKRKKEAELLQGSVDADISGLSINNLEQSGKSGLYANFIESQFPNLYLHSLSLDNDRNQYLKIIAGNTNTSGKPKKIKKSVYGVYNSALNEIQSFKDFQNSFKNELEHDVDLINKRYSAEIEKTPKNREILEKKRRNALLETKEKYSKHLDEISVREQAEKDKDKKYKQKMLKAFEGIVELSKEKNKVKSNAIDDSGALVRKAFSKPKSIASSLFNKFSAMLTGGLAAGGAALLTGSKKLFIPVLSSSFSYLWKLTKKHKRASALTAGVGLALLGMTYKDVIIEKIKSFNSSLGKYFKGPEDYKEKGYSTGDLIGILGTGLLAVPNPYAKIVGVLLMSGSALSNLNFGKIISDAVAKFPILKYIIPDDMLESLKKPKNTKNKKLTPQEIAYKKAQDFSNNHKYFKNKKISEYEKELTIIKDAEKREQLIKKLHELDANKDGVLDIKDKQKLGESFDKISKEFSSSLQQLLAETSSQYHLLNSKTESERKEFLEHVSRQNLLISQLSSQMNSMKFDLTVLSSDDLKTGPSYNMGHR